MHSFEGGNVRRKEHNQWDKCWGLDVMAKERSLQFMKGKLGVIGHAREVLPICWIHVSCNSGFTLQILLAEGSAG